MKTIKIDAKLVNTVKNMLVPLMLIAQTGLFAYYLFAGVSTVFGERINVISAITLVFSITKISTAAVYKAIFGSVLGIIYFVFGIKILKDLLDSCQYVKPALKNIELNTHTVNSVILLHDSFGKSFFKLVAYTVISRMISLYEVPSGVFLVFIAAAVLNFIMRIVIALIRRNDLLDAIYTQIVCFGIFFAAIGLLLANISNTTLYNAFDIFKAVIYVAQNSDGLIPWVNFVEQFAANNILLIIIQVCILVILNDLLTATHHFGASPKVIKETLAFSVIAFAIHVVVSAYVANELGFDFISAAIHSVKQHVYLVILSGISFCSLRFPTQLELSDDSEDGDKSEPQQQSSTEPSSESVASSESEESETVAEVAESSTSSETTESVASSTPAGIGLASLASGGWNTDPTKR